MRNYIRHPVSIPIQVSSTSEYEGEVEAHNLSTGGLCFFTEIPVKVGSVVDLSISYVQPDYKGEGIIVWRRGTKPSGYEVGVRFANDDEYFRMRMVEQVCQIEKYRQHLAELGRNLTPEAAALDWIERFAAEFDQHEETSVKANDA
jgi:hypothetical protein